MLGHVINNAPSCPDNSLARCAVRQLFDVYPVRIQVAHRGCGLVGLGVCVFLVTKTGITAISPLVVTTTETPGCPAYHFGWSGALPDQGGTDVVNSTPRAPAGSGPENAFTLGISLQRAAYPPIVPVRCCKAASCGVWVSVSSR